MLRDGTIPKRRTYGLVVTHAVRVTVADNVVDARGVGGGPGLCKQRDVQQQLAVDVLVGIRDAAAKSAGRNRRVAECGGVTAIVGRSRGRGHKSQGGRRFDRQHSRPGQFHRGRVHPRHASGHLHRRSVEGDRRPDRVRGRRQPGQYRGHQQRQHQHHRHRQRSDGGRHRGRGAVDDRRRRVAGTPRDRLGRRSPRSGAVHHHGRVRCVPPEATPVTGRRQKDTQVQVSWLREGVHEEFALKSSPQDAYR